jgi:Protein of unknown function (DUF1203)
MLPIRIVAIPTEIAEAVRATLRAPVYGFPAHAEVATDTAPCRHCLRTFAPGKDRRILFTYDRFAGIEPLPQPGPIYLHACSCARYPEDGGFPEQLREPAHTRSLRVGPPPCDSGIRSRREVRAGHRKVVRQSRSRLSSGQQHHGWVLHLPHRTRHCLLKGLRRGS